MPTPDNWAEEARRLARIVEEADAIRPDPVLPDAAGSVDPGIDLGMVECE